MAIAKMNKLTLISLQDKKETILQALQGIQSVELIDMSKEYEQVHAVSARKRDKISDQIKEVENKYIDHQDQLQFLQSHLPQLSMLAKLRQPREGLTLHELEQQTQILDQDMLLSTVKEKRRQLKDIDQDLQRLKEEEDFLIKWKKLSHVPSQLSENNFIQTLTGTVPQTASDDFIRNIRKNDKLVVEEVYQTRDEYGINVIFDKQDEANVKDLLEENHFFKLSYSFTQVPGKELDRLKQEREVILTSQNDLRKELSEMKEAERSLMLIIETLYAKLQRLRGELLLVDEPNLFILEGWIEDKKILMIREAIAEQLAADHYALLVADVKEEEYDKVPIVLENNSVIAPFETITEMYSLPKYNEIDPTPFLMPFYFVFFGMMLADVGYGLMMLIATVIAQKFFTLSKGMKRSMRFFQLLSYSTIGWGLIYGSFMGLELPIVPLSIMDDVNTILIMSVVFGVIQILLGLSLKAYLLLKEKDVLGAIYDGFGWIILFAGLIILVIGNMVIPSEMLSTIGVAIALMGVVMILLASTIATKNKAMGFGIGLYNLYGITGYVGDMVSYTRLMALGVSGGSIALAFNMIIDFLPVGARFTIGILLFVVLHLVNIGLSALSAYVHGARLIFVEFFGKFYEGGGKAFKPLKTSEEYIDLKNSIEG